MAPNNTQVASPAKVQFIQYHQPALPDGDYRMELTQTISDGQGRISQTPYGGSLDFTIAGARFSLQPGDIQAMFPPPSSLGDHANVLPHIALTRSTLPWERSAIDGALENPWMVLLVFDQAEAPKAESITLAELQKTPANQFPPFAMERAQHENDVVEIIDVPRALLQDLMPTAAELSLMAHVRQPVDAQDQPVGESFAVVFANRLPRPGRQAVVHLVSVENRYTPSGFDFSSMGDTIRLVTLKSWRFACTDPSECFEGLMNGLNRTPSTLRLPPSTNLDVEAYYAQGFVPLRRHQQDGKQTVSWYRSPLLPGPNSQTVPLPIHTSGVLIKTNPANGLVDVSYAAAWEIGRLITLQSKRASLALYNWKRRHARALAQLEQELSHLPIQPRSDSATDTPEHESVVAWFRDLNLLKGVPFNYLVPDERMLPVESIRFFQVDPAWIECLLDGAFSIGRVMHSDYQMDQQLADKRPEALVGLSGFLLRSDVVAGWPSLVADADASDGSTMLPVRMERLSSHTLLCLFAGTPKVINIHLKPESIHFGVEEVALNRYEKRRRDADGNLGTTTIAIPWRSADHRVVDLASLATSLDASTSADFALEMIDGAPKFRFVASS